MGMGEPQRLLDVSLFLIYRHLGFGKDSEVAPESSARVDPFVLRSRERMGNRRRGGMVTFPGHGEDDDFNTIDAT